ncbi:MAG: branched-chain amino acid ABC transporter ATP-binding protein [Spirochaetes bacterium]|nr:MAG: branched-chain amino acid ABC transporter ATP-binding protein [Spirochaetota bacterium]
MGNLQESILNVEKLSSGYGAMQVLWNVDIEVHWDEAVCIIGSNGAGKSTLMRTLMGINQPWGGKIYFRGEDITHSNSSERVSRRITLVPEGRQLFYGLSVEDNLMMGAYLRKRGSEVKESLDFVYQTFPALKNYRKRFAGSLSGGEQQMCAVGRALMAEPQLLLIDELSLGLAPVIVDMLIELLQKIRKERSLSILLVEQDVEAALEITDRGYVLETGHITLSGSRDELSVNEHVRKAYLGIPVDI